MKKNVTINLCGRLYSIDEDAYELLKHYTETLRRYYKRHEGDEEIADDIEQRIAELFDEKKAAGVEAITIEHLQEIIRRVGDLQELAPDADGDATDDEEQKSEAHSEDCANGFASESTQSKGEQFVNDSFKNWFNGLKGKTYYRDPNDKMVSGVLSGCANYFGGSVLMWRLCYVLLVIAGFLSLGIGVLLLVAYLLLALIAREAQSPEDRLKMKGRDVNPHNLSEEVTSSVVNENKKDTVPESNAKGCFAIIMSGVAFFFKLVLIGLCLLLVIPAIVVFFIFIAVLAAPNFVLDGMFGHSMCEVYANNNFLFLICGICIVFAFAIPAFCAFNYIFNKSHSIGYWQRLFWFFLWILACGGIVATCVMINGKIDFTDNLEREKRDAEWRAYAETHTHDGWVMDDEDWTYFQANGWKLICNDNCDEDYTDVGEYYNGDRTVRYINVERDGYDNVVFQVEHADTVGYGYYRLTALARCSETSDGVFVYACTDKDDRHYKEQREVPALGNSGRGISAEQNGGVEVKNLGYGWSQITIDSIPALARPAIIRYGISTDKAVTGKDCSAEWFSAADFKLERMN